MVRHSRAKRCEIRLTQSGGRVRAEVRDDGQGPRLERAENGVRGSGLAGLAERVRASGGQFEAGPLPDGGFLLRVTLPPGEDDGAETGGRAPSEVSAPERAR